MQSPVAILQKQRQYRASSYSQGTPFGMATGTTPSSFSSSFIDHAFDHPTPTSFSQLQLLSSSVTSQDGSDYTHRVPKVEEQFCSGFNCCGLELDDLHHLLEHFEECHVLPGGGSTPASASAAAAIAAASGRAGAPSGSNSNNNNNNNNSSSSNSNSNNNAPSSSSAAAGPSSSSSHSKNASSALASRNGVSLSHDDEDADGDADGEGEGDGPSDMPDFDDFEGDSPSSTGAGGGALQPGGSSSAAGIVVPGSSGHGPTLSAPPSPALSSYSDHHPPNGGGSGTSNLYELKTKRRLGSGAPPSSSNNNSNSSFPIFNTNGAPSKSGGRVSSTSPPSDYEDANSMHSEDEHSGVLPFTRRNRQQSVDSLASVSTNASTSSKKRNFNTALGPSNPNHSSSNINIANIPAGMQGHQPSKPSLTGLDFANIRGRTSGFSTPDSSVPGTPASEHEGIEMPGVGCLPPSLLFPLRHNSRNPYSSAEEDMTTDEEDDDGRSLSYDQDASGTDGEDGDGDDIDDNIRFQHQLLQQQQMLYGQQMQALQQQQNGGMNNGSMGIQPQQMMGGINMNMTMGNNSNNSNNMNNGQFNFAAMNGMNMAGFAQGNNNQQGQQQQQQQQQWDPSAMNFNMAAYGNQMMNGNMGNMNMNMMNNNNNNNFANMLGTTPTAEPSMKKKKMQQQQQQSGGPSSSSGGGGGGSSSKPKKNKSGSSNKHNYDASIDSAAAAMFSPLTLQNGQGSNIPMPTISASTSPSSQATASAATLAAIQAAAAANAFPDASTPTGRVWIPNNAKPFKCPVPGCDKAYKQQNGLKYHRLHGHCNQNSTGEPAEEGEDPNDKEEDKPFGCYVGPACGKKYKNMNGLRYHYQHSGAHGQIGLQMLTNGTHPPPAYPPGHKRAGLKNYGAEFSNNPSPTVVMNQSTAEAILAAISGVGSGNGNGNGSASGGSQPGSKNNSRPSTPGSRNLSPQTKSPLGQHA